MQRECPKCDNKKCRMNEGGRCIGLTSTYKDNSKCPFFKKKIKEMKKNEKK